MSLNPLWSRLRSREQVSFAELTAALTPHLPLLNRLAQTPQEVQWHAEGDVAAHSALVFGEAQELADEAELTGEDRLIVLLAAALHDIGKALTTREELDAEGVTRLRSRQHARRGRDYLAFRLLDAELSHSTVKTVLQLIAQHHSVHSALDTPLDRGLWALARRVPLLLLDILTRADLRGRRSLVQDPSHSEENIDLLKLGAEELGLWHRADPYGAFKAELQRLLPDAEPDLLRLAIGRGLHDWEAGVIHTHHEAVARVQDAAKQAFPRLTVLCGPSGSGKSTLARRFPEALAIGLDVWRARLGKDSSDQSVNGQVLQAAREELRSGLRHKRHIIWDATSLRRDQRAQVLQLGHDYGALTEICLLWTPPSRFSAQNRGRDRMVHPAILGDQLQLLEFPEVSEAHEVRYVRPDGQEGSLCSG